MRKIWSRKDKEKRRSFNSLYPTTSNYDDSLGGSTLNSSIGSASMISNASGATTVNTANTTNTVTNNGTSTNSNSGTTANSSAITGNSGATNGSSGANSGPKSVTSLIKYDYDTKLIKNSWTNVIINTSVNDITDNSLKLMRAELKGSHLYLYKSNLNIKNFKPLELRDDVSLYGTGSIKDDFTPPEVFKHPNTSTTSVHSSVHSPVSQHSIIEDYHITYYGQSPHPDLKFDADTASFLPGNTIEPLIHFFLFHPDTTDGTTDGPTDGTTNNPHVNRKAIDQLTAMIPLFPDLGKSLRLINSFIVEVFAGKISAHRPTIIDRCLSLLTTIHDHFHGFLLKSDVAPYILKLLETAEELGQFKSKMLAQQQNLMGLITHDVDTNPFQDLSASYFLNHVNIIEFASTISAIDIQFFRQWNSSIDKSLLLYSSITESIHGDFFYNKNPLFFNNEFHIHYLARLLVNQLFLETDITSLNCSSSLLEFKARLLEKWIDLGCLLDKSGNMSSWLGIASMVLSQPILRLSKIWTFVSSDYIKLLKNDWSPVLFELDRRFLVNGVNSNPATPNQASPDLDHRDTSYHIMAPRGMGKIYPKEKVVPYFGDLIVNNLGPGPNSQGTNGTTNSTTNGTMPNIKDLESTYNKITYSFKRWNDYLEGLSNYNEIIKYNDDVLKRYDSMGFIFSNESLNQVLYLGNNTDDTKSLPQAFDATELSFPVNDSLRHQLYKLIDLNESFNLEKVMELSLNFQPELPEGYLKPVFKNHNASNVSLVSTESHEEMPRLPVFNNNHFKINIGQYDDLVDGRDGRDGRDARDARDGRDARSDARQDTRADTRTDTRTDARTDTRADDKHHIVIDDELVFRIDDFVTELDHNTSTYNALEEVDHEDDDEYVPGLGIDVDDILNSEKFSNFHLSDSASNGGASNGASGQPATSEATSNGPPTSNSGIFPVTIPSRSHQSFSIVSSDSSNLQIYKYIPKYATIDKLVDLLLIDSKYLDDSLTIDLTEYRFVFLLSYNSFITTRQLLEILAHRFINSGNAVISIMKRIHQRGQGETGGAPGQSPGQSSVPPSYPGQGMGQGHGMGQGKGQDFQSFPNWSLDSTVALNDLGEVDYSILLKIQINILKVLVVLINNFYKNFSTDLTNKKILVKLLKLFSNEILQWYNSNKIDTSLEKLFESLVTYYKKLKKLFVRKTYRPIELSKFDEFLITEFKFNNSLHEVPINRNLPGHKNVTKIEKFLHKFNKLLTIFYKGVRTEDWFAVFKVLEVEFERGGLMAYHTPRSDDIPIANIFSYLDSLTDDKVLVMKKFPLVFRKLFKLYTKFKTYILVQLTDLNITVDERLDRMKTLLYMVKICQVKMTGDFVFDGTTADGTTGPVPSCIETAITNVIYTPESRLFANLWVKAASAWSEGPYDDLPALLPPLSPSDLVLNEPLLPCFGWIIENLMTLNKCPNFSPLINFNKRYLVYKLIKELTVEDPEDHHDTREFEFLLKLDESLVNNQNLKEFTFLEKDKVKLFKTVLRDQQKILALEARKLPEEPRVVKKPSNPSIRRQSLTYKTNSSSRFKISGLFNKSRPGGSIGSRDLPPPSTDKQKPLVTIALKNKKIFPVYLMPYSFKIDNDVGGEDYFFQCQDEGDLNDWLMKLNYANRHWFYSKTLNFKSANHTTFGVPIAVVCNRQGTMVPRFLTEIFRQIEADGIKDVGVYRISTSLSELGNLKAMIDRTGGIDFVSRGYDTHALTSCVKSFLRELPDALLTDKVIERLFKLRQDMASVGAGATSGVGVGAGTGAGATAGAPTSSVHIAEFKTILKSLPPVNYETFKCLTGHLHKVASFSDDNKMTPTNIATVIGPALTEASSLELLMNNFGFINFVLEKVIVKFNEIFDVQEEGSGEQIDEQIDEETDELESLQTDGVQTDGLQTDEVQTDEVQTQISQTQISQTQMSQTDNQSQQDQDLPNENLPSDNTQSV
ncbi:hypothetical protein CLIB1444_22S00122 [[Candida] jaroonii]|uniref:Uncharacterized protein n=1 Tax=[Candida] jaroonii TaxID=467808 RepID=A0ACA9YFK3_9ASCO|nr:hypothetical protein CLIB1444_22S00122 [[Candida] jaroonii]